MGLLISLAEVAENAEVKDVCEGRLSSFAALTNDHEKLVKLNK